MKRGSIYFSPICSGDVLGAVKMGQFFGWEILLRPINIQVALPLSFFSLVIAFLFPLAFEEGQHQETSPWHG